MPARILLICALVLCMSLPAMSRDHPVKPEELLTRIAHADKVVVSYGQGEPAYTSTSTADIAALKAAITIEPPQGWFLCACMPELVIRLFHNGKEIGAILVYPDGLTIGFKP